MKWDYHVRVEVDTNDADYIHNDYNFGTYDDEDEESMKSLALEVIVYNHFEVDDGENDFDVTGFLDDLKKFGLKPSNRCEDWKKYDCLLDYDSDAFYDLDEYEDKDYEDDNEEDENTKTLPEKDEEDEDNGDVPEKILILAAELKNKVEDEIGDCLPWMDNCWNNHSFSYELTRRPAGVKEENCEVNYDAKTYQELLKYEDLNNDDDADFETFDDEGENAEV